MVKSAVKARADTYEREVHTDMKSFFRHKWVIPIAALVLTVSLGAVAFAAGGAPEAADCSGVCAGEESCVGAALLINDEAQLRGLSAGAQGAMGVKRWMQGGPGRPELSEEQKAELEKRRQEMESRRQAMLDLVKEKMSAEDQAELARLQSTVEEQQEALKKAREELSSTMKEMRDLINKYLDVAGSSTGEQSPGAGVTSL